MCCIVVLFVPYFLNCSKIAPYDILTLFINHANIIKKIILSLHEFERVLINS